MPLLTCTMSLHTVIDDDETGSTMWGVFMTINGGELLARALDAADLHEVFTLHGGHLDAFLVACGKYGIRLTDTRHESTAGHAADAWARQTGRVGVCVTTSGPGFTNTYTAIANAYLDAIPVLFIVGAPPLREAETNPLQGGFDQVAAAAPVTKWTHRVTHGARIPELVALALRTAQSGRPGPVLLEIPIDVMFSPVDESPVRMPDFGTPPRTAPTGGQVDAALGLLARAERPVLLFGGGAARSDCARELAEFAELLSLPVFVPNKGDGVLPAGHRLSAGGLMPLLLLPQAVGAPDVAVLIGGREGMFTGGRSGPLSQASVIHINTDAVEIGRLNDSAVAIGADCRETLSALITAAHDRTLPDFGEWAQQAVSMQHFHQAMFTETDTASGRVHPYFAAKEIIAALPPRTVVVLDGAEAPAWAEFHLAPSEPNSTLRLGYLGCLGVGPGFAIGARRADPDRPVAIITGDGAAGFHLGEFDTMARHGIPAVTMVFNNASWGMSQHGQQAVFGESGRVVSALADSAYEQVAIAFGGYGERVERLEDVGPAIRRAFASGKPAAINIAVDAEVVHPLTLAMLGDLSATDSIVIPYYDNIPVA